MKKRSCPCTRHTHTSEAPLLVVVRQSSSNLRKSPYFMLLESLGSKLSWKVVCVGTPPVYLSPPTTNSSSLFLFFSFLYLVSFSRLLHLAFGFFSWLMLNSSPFISNYLLNKNSEIIFAISTSYINSTLSRDVFLLLRKTKPDNKLTKANYKINSQKQ